MMLNITLLTVDLDWTFRIWGVTVMGIEVKDGRWPSLLQFGYVNGSWAWDILYLHEPMTWVLRKIFG